MRGTLIPSAGMSRGLLDVTKQRDFLPLPEAMQTAVFNVASIQPDGPRGHRCLHSTNDFKNSGAAQLLIR
jgi:hypothetical protein